MHEYLSTILSYIEKRTNQITNQLTLCLRCLQTLLLHTRKKTPADGRCREARR
jgi:hypothetical protein